MEFDLLSWIQKDAFFTLQMLLGIVMGFSGSLTTKKNIIKISAVTLFAKERIKESKILLRQQTPYITWNIHAFMKIQKCTPSTKKILRKGIPPAREQNSLW